MSAVGSDVWLVIAITVIALGIAAWLWRRLPPRAAAAAVSLLAGALGAGALSLQDDPGPADWIVGLSLLVVFAPVHCRFAFGPPGRPPGASRVVAAAGDGA